MAAKGVGDINGWNSIKLRATSENVRVSFRSKEKPRQRGAIHELADQMMKEGNS